MKIQINQLTVPLEIVFLDSWGQPRITDSKTAVDISWYAANNTEEFRKHQLIASLSIRKADNHVWSIQLPNGYNYRNLGNKIILALDQFLD